MKDLRELAQRRDLLCKNPPSCDLCGTRQVQLIDYTERVVWKCRHCGYKWEEGIY